MEYLETRLEWLYPTAGAVLLGMRNIAIHHHTTASETVQIRSSYQLAGLTYNVSTSNPRNRYLYRSL